MERYKKKWWVEENTVDGEEVNCRENEVEEDATSLDMDHLGGVFLVLLCGLAISFIMGLGEFLWNVKKVSIEERVSTEYLPALFKLALNSIPSVTTDHTGRGI